MRTISLCAIAAAMVAIGVTVWAGRASTPVAAPVGQGVDPYQIMTNTKGLAPAKLVDFTFVFD